MTLTSNLIYEYEDVRYVTIMFTLWG